MNDNRVEYLMDPVLRTVEIEHGRFVEYKGSGRWESYLQSRRGARTPDGPLMTSSILERFSPGSLQRDQIQRIIAAIDG